MTDSTQAVGPFACPCGGTPHFEPAYYDGWYYDGDGWYYDGWYYDGWYCVCECYDGPECPIGFHATKIGAWIDWLWKADRPAAVGWVRFPLRGGV